MPALPSAWLRKPSPNLLPNDTAQHSASWKNQKHSAQWTVNLQTYAHPVIGNLLVRDITAAHVIRVFGTLLGQQD